MEKNKGYTNKIKSHMWIYILIGIILGLLISKVNFGYLQQALPQACSYKGQTLQDGEEFKDDCNYCSCADGHINCTAMACGGS